MSDVMPHSSTGFENINRRGSIASTNGAPGNAGFGGFENPAGVSGLLHAIRQVHR